MKILGAILAAILSSQLLLAAADSIQPRNDFNCAARTLELTSAVSRCRLPSDIPEVEIDTLVETLDTAVQLLDFSEQVLQEMCKPACGQPIVDFFFECGLADVGRAAVELCGVLNDNSPCYSLVTPESEESFKLGPGDFATAAIGVCQDGSCSSDCRNSLISLSDEVGCCIYLADTDLFSGLRNIVEDSFWAACNLTIPEECTQPLNLNLNGAAAGTAATLVAVITTTVIALLVQ